jgi:phytoene dehydrogenase-like protein
MTEPASQTRNFDAVIVGGGHNGLVAGCFLAKQGYKAVVLEARHKIGGMASSEFAIPEAPNHVIHPCAIELASMRGGTIPEDLELERHGFKMISCDPAYAYLHTDGSSLCFFRDVQKTADEIRKYSEKDARAYFEFIKTLGALASIVGPIMKADPKRMGMKTVYAAARNAIKNRKVGGELLAFLTGTAAQVAEERFEHIAVRSAIAGFAGGAGPIDRDSSSLGFLLFAILHSTGFGRVAGGMQNLSNALASRFEELGGTIVKDASVAEIISEGKSVRGARTEDGQIYFGRVVIGACHPLVTMNLVTEGEMDSHLMTRVRHAPRAAHGSSPFRMDLALNGRVNWEAHQKERKDGIDLRIPTVMIGTIDDAVANFQAASRGELPDPNKPYSWFTTTTGADPSQAPDGQDVMYFYPVAWPVRPREGWESARPKSVDICMGWARSIFPDIDSKIIGTRVESADELEKRLNVPGGSFVHTDVTLLRSGSMRPAAGLAGDLPVSGLIFGSAGGPGGGGVSGVPGSIAAGRAARYLKKH